MSSDLYTTDKWVTGSRGTADWVQHQDPDAWRAMIHKLMRIGDVPITYVTSGNRVEMVNNATFHWWTDVEPTWSATVTSIYTDASMTSEYTTGGAEGDVLYAKLTTDNAARQYREGSIIRLETTDTPADATAAEVLQVQPNGANSRVTFKLLMDDPTTTGLASCDSMLLIGDMRAELSGIPTAISWNPEELENYTQIFMEPVNISRTAKMTNLRTPDAYNQMKADAFIRFVHQIEMQSLYGIKWRGVGANGKPKRSTGGLEHWCQNHGGLNENYALDIAYSGLGWEAEGGGRDWLDEQLINFARYSGRNPVAIAGIGAIQGIRKLAHTFGDYQFVAGVDFFGDTVTKWMTPYLEIALLRHPQISYHAPFSNRIMMFHPEDFLTRAITDMKYVEPGDPDVASYSWQDGDIGLWLAELGFEQHYPGKLGILDGVGLNNELS